MYLDIVLSNYVCCGLTQYIIIRQSLNTHHAKMLFFYNVINNNVLL